jgi:site-specific DNA-methyltransferase (adenine-specific)
MLTKRQKQVLDFVQSFISKKGYSPSLQEIQKRFQLSSISTVHYHISKLIKIGCLNQQKGKARSISIPEKEVWVKIPLLGTIAAGEPIEAIQSNEFISVPKTKLPKVGEVYALQVSGDSMIDENIKDGDIILVKQQEVAENGQRVVVLIDNYEATLKKIYREGSKIRLQPANSEYEPIIIRKDRNINIQGIVIDVIHNEKNIQAQKIESFKTIKRKTKLPLNKIILGDAIAGLKNLPDKSCDVIIIDPPYNIGKDFGNNSDKRELNEYVAWCKEWINESIRVMKPTATMFIYGFSEILAHLSVEIPIKKRWLIWHYTNKNVASLNFWQRSHESIICAWKDNPLFNRDDIREPYTEGFLNGAAGKIRKDTVGRFSKGGKQTVYKAHEKGALPRDVIKIPALAGGAGISNRWFLCKNCDKVFISQKLREHDKHEIVKHPTQKPLELSRKLILSAMPKKDGVVLVPFVGTGAECAAAKELGQFYIGFEINPDYVKIAKKFIDSVNYTPKLF